MNGTMIHSPGPMLQSVGRVGIGGIFPVINEGPGRVHDNTEANSDDSRWWHVRPADASIIIIFFFSMQRIFRHFHRLRQYPFPRKYVMRTEKEWSQHRYRIHLLLKGRHGSRIGIRFGTFHVE